MRGSALVGFLASLALLALSAGAEETADSNAEGYTLEDLLRIKVITPAKIDQSVAESPGVISVLTAEQIRDLGVTSVHEALSYLPGVLVTDSYFGYAMVNVRGQLHIHYNNKVLLMINGHPTREVINGSSHFELVPIAAIDRIEFVRGPGSALYGTNAFAGVVNIITKHGTHPTSREIQLGAGSFGTWEVSAVYGSVSDGTDVMVSVSSRNDDGYPYRVRVDERGQSGELDFENDLTNALAVVRIKEFTVSAAAFTQSKSKLGITPVIDYTGTSRYRSGFLDLTWEHGVTDGLSVTGQLRYDSINRDSTEVGSFPFDGFLGHDSADVILDSSGELFGAELSLCYDVSDDTNLLGGVVYEDRRADPYTFTFADDGSPHPGTAFSHSPTAHNLSVYGQGLFKVTPRTSAVLGVRYSNDSESGSVFLPRMGLVYRLASDVYLKAQYAEAYRTPDFFQTQVETFDVLYGNPDLDPERTRNLDLALDTALGEHHYLQVNGFILRTEDPVVRQPTNTPEVHGQNAAVYANAGGEETWGVEIVLNARPDERLRYFCNYSYREGEDRETGADLRYMANHTANGGLVWEVHDRVALKPNAQYVDRRGDVGAYALLNMVVTVVLSPTVSLELAGRNLTDETYEYPEYIRGQIPAIPGGPERSFFVHLTWKY